MYAFELSVLGFTKILDHFRPIIMFTVTIIVNSILMIFRYVLKITKKINNFMKNVLNVLPNTLANCLTTPQQFTIILKHFRLFKTAKEKLFGFKN